MLKPAPVATTKVATVVVVPVVQRVKTRLVATSMGELAAAEASH
jgi:hypothetical protein